MSESYFKGQCVSLQDVWPDYQGKITTMAYLDISTKWQRAYWDLCNGELDKVFQEDNFYEGSFNDKAKD